MMSMPIVLVLGTVFLVSYLLAQFYASLSVNELKMRSRSGDQKAMYLFQVTRHSVAGPLLLKAVSFIAFVSLVSYLGRHQSFLGVLYWVSALGLVFYLLKSRVSVMSPLAVLISPYYAKLILFIKPYLVPVAALGLKVQKKSVIHYSKEDIVDLLNQKKSHLVGIDKSEIDMAISVMHFKDKMVQDHLVPRKVVHFVDSSQQITTTFINELHESGFSRFPVYAGSTDSIVGTLFLKDLVEKRQSGKVANAMSSDVYEIDSDASLETALALFLKTKHHLFIVKNEFHEVAGIITIEDVLEQLIGRKIVDESDVHEDMRELAKKSEK